MRVDLNADLEHSKPALFFSLPLPPPPSPPPPPPPFPSSPTPPSPTSVRIQDYCPSLSLTLNKYQVEQKANIIITKLADFAATFAASQHGSFCRFDSKLSSVC
jgi:hypothetical protein